MELSGLKAACHPGILKLLAVAAFMIFISGCQTKKETLPFYNTADFTAEWIPSTDSRYATIHTIDSFSLYNQSGHIINRDSLKGHIYIANFFFTSCPGICPVMINNLEKVAAAFTGNKRVKLLSFSVMPEVDSVQRLSEYGQQHHINPSQWWLLTGNTAQINQLGRLSYFSEKRAGLTKENSAFLHTESLLLIDAQSRIRGIYTATNPEQMTRVIDDMRILLEE